MASSDKSIHNFANGTLTENSLFPMAYTSGAGYASGKISASELGEGLGEEVEYQSLNTGDKTLFGAINELLTINTNVGVAVTGTLEAGNTSLTLQDSNIHTDSLLDFYTDTFGVNPIDAVVTEGQVVLTFEEQASDLNVSVIVRGISKGEGLDLDGELSYQLRTGMAWEYVTEDLSDVMMLRVYIYPLNLSVFVKPEELPLYTGTDVYVCIGSYNNIDVNMSLTATGYRISLNGSAFNVDVYLIKNTHTDMTRYISLLNDEVDVGGYKRNTSTFGLMPITDKRVVFNSATTWSIKLKFSYIENKSHTQVLCGNNSAFEAYYLTPSIEISSGGSSIIGRVSNNGSTWGISLTINNQFVAGSVYSIVLDWDGTNLTMTLYDSSDTVIGTQTTACSTVSFSGFIALGTIAQKSEYICDGIAFDVNSSQFTNGGAVIW